MNTFSVLDSVIFIVYVLLIVVIGLWCSRTRKGGVKDSKEYFLAGNTLPWWAIGASVIASNISAVYRHVRIRLCHRTGNRFL